MKKHIINLLNKNEFKCSGCTACANLCKSHAISLVADSEGFIYPVIDEEKCNECGLCIKKCSVINMNGIPDLPQNAYAIKSNNNEIRKNSSSGGVFSLIMEDILKRNGVVFGAAFNNNWILEHSYAETYEEAKKFNGSKYVQSRLGSSFIDVKRFLSEKRDVLFSGTPCQISGLKKFLGKEYENLTTVSMICHGAPSPCIFEKYVSDLGISKKEITGINFRDKIYGWKNYSLRIDYRLQGKPKSYICRNTEDPYLQGFIKNLFLRPSCHDCKSKQFSCGADIILADMWSCDAILKEFNDEKGVSLVIPFSGRGSNLIEEIKKESDVRIIKTSDGLLWNDSWIKSSAPHLRRDKFFSLIHSSNKPACLIIRECINPTRKELFNKHVINIYNTVLYYINAVIRRIKFYLFNYKLR